MARILRADAERLLGNAPEEYTFECCDGRIFRNMKDLLEAFASMTDETFAFHANAEKNDFSNWIKDIIRDDKLARDLGKSASRAEAAKRVRERITFLSSKLG